MIVVEAYLALTIVMVLLAYLVGTIVGKSDAEQNVIEAATKRDFLNVDGTMYHVMTNQDYLATRYGGPERRRR